MLATLFLSVSVNTAYVKGAGTVVLGWASWQVIATILAVGGLTVYAVTLDEYKEEVVQMGDDLGDWIVNRWNSNNEKVLEVKAELDRIIVDAQIYGRIENMSKDLFDAIKGFISNILSK